MRLAGSRPVLDAVRLPGDWRRARPRSPPVHPATCPICGAETAYEPKLSSKRRGAGWRCLSGSASHYWHKMGLILAEKFARNPWLFPPVVLREGQQCFAWDGIQDGDQMLYPGIRRSEIITSP